MPPDEPIDEERQQELDQDNQTPFQPAGPNPSPTGNTTDPVIPATGGDDIPDEHPQTDTNLDTTELYDEGVGGAAEVENASGQTAVTDFTAPNQTTDENDSSDV